MHLYYNNTFIITKNFILLKTKRFYIIIVPIHLIYVRNSLVENNLFILHILFIFIVVLLYKILL